MTTNIEKFDLIPSSESISKVIKESKLSKENVETLNKLKSHIEQYEKKMNETFGNSDSCLVNMSVENYRYSISSIAEIGKLKRENEELKKTQSFENTRKLIEENILLKKDNEELKKNMEIKTFKYFLIRVKHHISNFINNK
jgi:hypothetical protein